MYLFPLQDIFVDFSQVDGQYFVCNMDDFKFSAELIQHIPLSLRVRYVFCTAPINKKQPFVCSSLLQVSPCLYILNCFNSVNFPKQYFVIQGKRVGEYLSIGDTIKELKYKVALFFS